MMNRRRWLQVLSGAPLLGAALEPALGGNRGGNRGGGRGDLQPAGDWPLGEVFRVDSAGGRELRLAGVLPGRPSAGLVQFGLVFVGAADLELSAGSHRLNHSELGPALVYLEPMDDGPESHVYIAEFSLLGESEPPDARRLWRRLAI